MLTDYQDHSKPCLSFDHASVGLGRLLKRKLFDHGPHTGHFGKAQGVLGVGWYSARPTLNALPAEEQLVGRHFDRFVQFKKSPLRHAEQVPSWPPCQPTPTGSPFVQFSTPAPTSSITPMTSCPGTRGYEMPGTRPSLTITSLWQIPQA